MTGGGESKDVGALPVGVRKRRTAALSVVSNLALIVLKVVVGTLTGSIAILAEALHSSIDLIASLVAFLSLRIATEPADQGHLYGHDKVENLSALIEAMLILVGSFTMGFEAIRRLINGGSTRMLWLGIVVVGLSALVNVAVASVISFNARATRSPALAGDAAHLYTDALSSGVVAVALLIEQLTGAHWLDPVAALIVALLIVSTGVRLMIGAGQVLLDQALPPVQTHEIEAAVQAFAGHGVIGYHQLRTRSSGSQRYVDLHVQFRTGTSLEDAHRTAHELQAQIAAALGGADVLIHLEPETMLRPGQPVLGAPGSGEQAGDSPSDSAGGQAQVSGG